MRTVLWIGETESPEFATSAALRLRRHVVVAQRIEDALQREPAADWELAVVAEAFPGDRWSDAIDALRRRRPTLPIVRLCGPGCDGELRSHPPAAVHRYRWLESPAALLHDFQLLDRGECPSWGRPITQSTEESLLTAVACETPLRAGGLRIGLMAEDASVTAWLSAAAAAWDAQTVRLFADVETSVTVDVVLWQVPDEASVAARNLKHLNTFTSPDHIVALLAFPRVSKIAELQVAGIRQVVALPATDALAAAIAAAAGTLRTFVPDRT